MDGKEMEGNGEKDMKARCKHSGRKKDRQSVCLRWRQAADDRPLEEPLEERPDGLADRALLLESFFVASKITSFEGRKSFIVLALSFGAASDFRFAEINDGEGWRIGVGRERVGKGNEGIALILS